MPHINGFELLKTIRFNPDFSFIPVIMVTSCTGQHYRQQGADLGANAYLGKPILQKVYSKPLNLF